VISYTRDGFWNLTEGWLKLSGNRRERPTGSSRRILFIRVCIFKRAHSSRPIYSVRVNLDYRAVGIRDGKEIVWHWIGPRDEYEKLIGRM